MPSPTHYTISAAARLCGCPRSTLQRAIRAGRLHLDTEHRLSVDELATAGYLHAPDAQQPRTPGAQRAIQDFYTLLRSMQQTLEQVTQRLATLQEEVQQLRLERSSHPPAPPRHTQQQQRSIQPATGADCPPFDATKNRLGRLCPRGHEWGNTGQSLLRLPNQTCRQCENELRREKRAARRQG